MSESNVVTLHQEQPAKAKAGGKPRVLITDNINESAVEILAGCAEVIYKKSLTAEELKAAIGDVDALMVRSASQVTADVLAAAKHLKIVGRAGVGTDNIDLKEATQRGVIVINSPEGNTIAASEHTVGMLFAVARHIAEGDASLKAGKWNRSKLVGVELYGKTLGVIGLGKIGGRVAKIARAVGMAVNVYDPYLSADKAAELDVTPVDLDTIWAKSDFITLHAPKTKETANLVNKDTLAKCKAGVRFVNCARGGIINETDLMAAIESGHVAGAALDVFEQEPLAADHPLTQMGHKVVITPHLGASTEEAQVNVALDVARQIKEFFETGDASSAVNIPILRREILDPVRPYMPMAETLGNLAQQVSSGVVQSIEITAKGTPAKEDIAPLVLATLKGALSQTCENVNYVNARLIAEERGIVVKQSTVKTVEGFQNLLEVSLITQTGTTRVAGTLLHGNNFRIAEINGCSLTLEPSPHILFTPHEDKPGMVGLVASILGNEQTNISALQVGRQGGKPGASTTGQSLMIFNLDTAVSMETLAAIRAQAGIIDAKYIHL